MLRSLGLAMAAILMVGCTGGGSQATPKETLQTMSSAVTSGDRGQFLACCKADANQKKTLEAMFDMMSSMARLKAAVEKAYGPDGWKKFHGATGGGDAMGPLDPDKLAKAQVEVKGDTATATIPGEGKPTTLVKEGGKWLIDAKQMTQEEVNPAEAQKMAGVMKPAMDKVIAEVGKPGQTPETLAQMMQAEKTKAIMGAAGAAGMPPPGAK